MDDGSAKRIMVANANSELFDACSVIERWILTLPVEQRPLIKYMRLLDAINGVREAHQMEIN